MEVNSEFAYIWPNGKKTIVESGSGWLEIANKADITIPTGCLCGSCGACEIEVNGEVIRACINKIPEDKSGELRVEFIYDPYW